MSAYGDLPGLPSVYIDIRFVMFSVNSPRRCGFPFEGAGVEAAAAQLGDVEGHLADPGHDGFGLKPIGIIGALCGSLMRPRVE